MAQYSILFVITLLRIFQETSGAKDSYSAVVVEYSPDHDPSVDPPTNVLNNVRNFVDIINIANSNFQADIIVFPESGLRGFGHQEQYMEVPDPLEHVRPCATNTTYDAPLVQLSCAARATQTYIVVNLGEKYYSSSQQKTVYFNTDVVFDSNGTIIARYRKIHLFTENGKSASPNKELVYFDTTFGVRFGIFTCFDILFEDPGVILANKFNITHFIFPSAWFSEMPFLTAIQEQYFWSYTQNVVLLASGYNDPSVGSSGTGVYLGRRGPAVYNMTQTRQTFMLHAVVPKKLYSKGVPAGEGDLKTETITFPTTEYETQEDLQSGQTVRETPDQIKLKQETFLNLYKTELIAIPESSMQGFNGTNFTVPFTVENNICQNTLCCKFSLNITAIFNKTREEITRGDDYSQLYYRLAVFDGVRHYEYLANGGVQTCAIIPCINSDISSCGLRADNVSTQPNTLYSFFQTAFIFDSIMISGNFSNNHSFVGPNVLLTGEGSNFGSLLPPESFNFAEAPVSVNGTVVRSFRTVKSIPKLVTASLYGRLFLRDDQPFSGNSSSSERYLSDSFLVLIVFYVSMCN